MASVWYGLNLSLVILHEDSEMCIILAGTIAEQKQRWQILTWTMKSQPLVVTHHLHLIHGWFQQAQIKPELCNVWGLQYGHFCTHLWSPELLQSENDSLPLPSWLHLKALSWEMTEMPLYLSALWTFVIPRGARASMWDVSSLAPQCKIGCVQSSGIKQMDSSVSVNPETKTKEWDETMRGLSFRRLCSAGIKRFSS